MMNRKEFYEYVKDNVKDYLPDSYQNGEISIEEVAKNNGLISQKFLFLLNNILFLPLFLYISYPIFNSTG